MKKAEDEVWQYSLRIFFKNKNFSKILNYEIIHDKTAILIINFLINVRKNIYQYIQQTIE